MFCCCDVIRRPTFTLFLTKPYPNFMSTVTMQF